MLFLTEDRKLHIEKRAVALRWELFNQGEQIWGRKPRGLEVADPKVAAEVLGVHLEYQRRLVFKLDSETFESAGVLNRRTRTILVSERFGDEVALFTAGHELGHWLLHDRLLQHRDAPISGIERHEPDTMEREANYFAASFLMPRRYLTQMFRARFPSNGPIVVDEAVADNLRPYDRTSLLHAAKNSRVIEKAFASATNFDRNYFDSLATMFKVSVETMAIRVEELGLVRK